MHGRIELNFLFKFEFNAYKFNAYKGNLTYRKPFKRDQSSFFCRKAY